jgi:single-strand DNA-binding protein
MAKATTTTAQAEKKTAKDINLVRIGGRLAADPELRHSANGLAHCKLRVAENTGKVAQFHPVVIFEQLAEQAADSFKKGDGILVEGRLRNRSYQVEDGSKRYVTEVIAAKIEPLEL